MWGNCRDPAMGNMMALDIEPIIGFQNINHDGDNLGTKINPGLRFIFHIGKNKMKPYLGFGYQAIILTGNDESYTDNIINLIYDSVDLVIFKN